MSNYNSRLVSAFTTAKDVLSKQHVCDYDIVGAEGEPPVINASPVCTVHGGVPTDKRLWSWCDKIDPDIPVLRSALHELVQYLHLEVHPS
jgi:hypothetical protein